MISFSSHEVLQKVLMKKIFFVSFSFSGFLCEFQKKEASIWLPSKGLISGLGCDLFFSSQKFFQKVLMKKIFFVSFHFQDFFMRSKKRNIM